jgi:nitroreductase/NAD-dependent dihydropyrimidine dehydrogenase PreA subunit
MSLFSIDEAKCGRDGICVAECPLKIIEMKDAKSTPIPAVDAAARCIGCGHCVAVCPHGALTHAMLAAADFPPVRKELALSTEQAEQFLRSRRSIRAYRDKPVEREKLQRLIELARYAPTGVNGQMVEWIVLHSRAEVERISGMVIDLFRGMIASDHPMAIKYRLKDIVRGWENGVDFISRGAPGLVFVHAPKAFGLAAVDCANALSYFDLAAPTLGLGACWGGFIMAAAAQYPPIRKTLSLPEENAVFGAMMAGYPKYAYHRLVPRNAPKIEWRM